MWLTTAVCVHFLSPLSKNYQLLLYYTRAMPVNRYRVYFVKRPKIAPFYNYIEASRRGFRYIFLYLGGGITQRRTEHETEVCTY